MAFEKTPGWLDWYADPSKPRFSCRRAASTRTATCSAPAPSSRSRPSASTRPATRARSSCSRCATTSASRATWSCRPPATAPTTARWSTPAWPRGGKARGVATVQPQRQRRRTAGDARRRRARRALQLRQAPGRLHAEGRAAGDRRAHRAARLARGDLFRGGGPARAVGLLHRAADHRGRRPHGPARREQADRRPGVRALPEVHARARERLEQGELPRALRAWPARRR